MVENYACMVCHGPRMLHEGQNRVLGSTQYTEEHFTTLCLADNAPGYHCMSLTADNAMGLLKLPSSV